MSAKALGVELLGGRWPHKSKNPMVCVCVLEEE